MRSALIATVIASALFLSNCATHNPYVIEDILEARTVSDHGLSLFVAGEFEAAITAFNAVIDYGTIESHHYTRRAAAYGAMEKYNVALKDTEEALRIEPDDWRAHLQRAVFHQRTHKFDEAIIDLDRALDINPDQTELLRRRAYLKIVAGRYIDAVADYDALTRAMPISDTGTLGRGVAQYLSGDWNKAANAFANILEKSPDDGLAMLWLAKSGLRGAQPIGWEEFADDAGTEREWIMAHLLVTETNIIKLENTILALYETNGTESSDACEHALFLGTWRLINDHSNGAKLAFSAAVQNCPVDSIEGAEARVELGRLNDAIANPQG